MLDEYNGQGGTYILDESGVRRQVEPATPSPEAPDNGTADTQAAHPRQNRKHVRN